MIKLEYIIKVSRRMKGDRGPGQVVCTWLRVPEATAREVVDLLNSKTVGGRPIEL